MTRRAPRLRPAESASETIPASSFHARSAASASTATSSAPSAWPRPRRGSSPSPTRTTAGIPTSSRPSSEGIGDARLAYSDARAVRPDGSVVSETLWRKRRNNHTSLASLLFANTVTGAASLFRRDLLDLVLPFPEAPGVPYHDHWTALVAPRAATWRTSTARCSTTYSTPVRCSATRRSRRGPRSAGAVGCGGWRATRRRRPSAGARPTRRSGFGRAMAAALEERLGPAAEPSGPPRA